MTGLIFTEFVDFAESRLGARVPSTDFSPTGRYPIEELLALVDRVAAVAGMTVPAVLESFGATLFARFAALYPVFFFEAGSAVDLLSQINTYVHGEVQKLYPDAEFPHFDVSRPSPDRLELVYHSSRPLADLAQGLIRGCIAHFGEPIEVERHDTPGSGGHDARFVLDVPAATSRRTAR